MINVMMKNKTKNMYVPAFFIAVIVLILLLVIGVSTFRHLDRYRSTMISFLNRQGQGVLKSLEAGIELYPSSFTDNPDILRLFNKISEIDDVSYIYITDNKGKVIYRSANSPYDIDFKTEEPENIQRDVLKKIIHKPDNHDIFQMTMAYFPPGVNSDNSRASSEKIITVGLFMSNYEESLEADFHHAIVMVSILLVLGSGLIFFIFVIQRYYVVDKNRKSLQEKVRRSEKLAAIGKLAAGVAHEIRNPLSSIRGFAQFLRHVLKDRPEERVYADVMVHEIDRINRVVSDLLIYSKPFEVKRKKQDLNEVIDHTLLLVHADAQEKKVNIIKKMPENMKDLWLDQNQITHALLNLLLNSLEAVTEGGEIEVGAELTDRNQVRIWVEDDGCGITDGYQEKIMDPFFTTRDKGTGLGLAIVHKIVENHNGEIRVTSPPPGKPSGTVISLLIPLVMNSEEELEI